VQLIGGMILNEGKIAEMKTGEGKTLMQTLAAYPQCLPELRVHVVTVNDYLAKRDAEWDGQAVMLSGHDHRSHYQPEWIKRTPPSLRRRYYLRNK